MWTGSEMIVWGGVDINGNFLNTGGRYDPSTDSWTATSTTNAPSARSLPHRGVDRQRNDRLGRMDANGAFNTGGRYNPSTDTWTATSITNAPDGRYYHTAVWTDSEMIVWGGDINGIDLNTGGRYGPGTDSWTATSTTNAPDARDSHTAVWANTTNQMIVWGGFSNLNTGGRYCAQSGATPTPTPTPQ